MDDRDFEELILHLVAQLSNERDDAIRERAFARAAAGDPEQSPRDQLLALLDAIRDELVSRDRNTYKRVVAGLSEFRSSDVRSGAIDDVVVSLGERDQRLFQTRAFSLDTVLDDHGRAVAALDALRVAIAEEPNPR